MVLRQSACRADHLLRRSASICGPICGRAAAQRRCGNVTGNRATGHPGNRAISTPLALLVAVRLALSRRDTLCTHPACLPHVYRIALSPPPLQTTPQKVFTSTAFPLLPSPASHPHPHLASHLLQSARALPHPPTALPKSSATSSVPPYLHTSVPPLHATRTLKTIQSGPPQHR